MQLICTASNTGFHMIGTLTSMGIFLLSGGFCLTNTGDSYDSRERKGTIFIPLYTAFTRL